MPVLPAHERSVDHISEPVDSVVDQRNEDPCGDLES